jgi:hypothetical protein
MKTYNYDDYKNSSEDPDVVRNRKDKSVLIVFTLKPDLLLQPSVAFPDKVKYLFIDCGTIDDNGISRGNTKLWYDWNGSSTEYNVYTKTLLKDLIHFHNLESFTAGSVRLEMNLWKEWALNCKNLREINFSNEWSENDLFEFDEETLETIFKIPTLRKVHIESLELPFFPPGPSNIEELTITARAYQHDFDKNDPDDDPPKPQYTVDDMVQSYSKNLCTHTNLKFLRIDRFAKFFMRPEPLLNVAKYCVNLEEIYLDFIEIVEEVRDDDYIDCAFGAGDASRRSDDQDDDRALAKVNDRENALRTKVLEQLLQLPKLKKCTLVYAQKHYFEDEKFYDKLVNDNTLVFPSIKELNFLINYSGSKLTKDDINKIVLKHQFPNLQIFNIDIPIGI